MRGLFFRCQELDRNGVIFDVDNSSSPHTIIEKIYVLVLGEGPTID